VSLLIIRLAVLCSLIYPPILEIYKRVPSVVIAINLGRVTPTIVALACSGLFLPGVVSALACNC